MISIAVRITDFTGTGFIFPTMVAPSSLAWKLTLLFGMLGTGAINTLSKKIQNQCSAVGVDGKSEPFSKPWSQTLVMFSGEACLIFVFLIQQFRKRSVPRRPDIQIVASGDSSFSYNTDNSMQGNSLNPNDDDLNKPLLAPPRPGSDDEAKEAATWKTCASAAPAAAVRTSCFCRYCLLIVPTCLDLLGTTFAGIGLLCVHYFVRAVVVARPSHVLSQIRPRQRVSNAAR